MPAPLDIPWRKVNLRLRDDDMTFIEGLCTLRGGSLTPTEFIRDLVHREVQAQKRRMVADAVRPVSPVATPST
jgi:hypothetical protein